jgi:hypothetical protein
MFQAVTPPIIRSNKTVHTALGIVTPILLPAAIVDEMNAKDVVFIVRIKRNPIFSLREQID